MNKDHSAVASILGMMISTVLFYSWYFMFDSGQVPARSNVEYPSMVVRSGTEVFLVQDVLGAIDASGSLRAITIKSPATSMQALAIVTSG